MRTITKAAALAAATVFMTATAATSAVSFDSATGTGFVGKGDVQLAFGWNNKQLQDNAAGVSFTVESETSQATTWTCDRDAGPQTQERSNTTTTTITGVAEKIARERNQITGFNLNGYDEQPSTSTESEGPAVGSCATGWTAIDMVVGEPVQLSGGLFVNYNGVSVALPNTPVV